MAAEANASAAPGGASVTDVSTPKKSGKTLLEIQPYLFGYGFGISLFSPTASLYQLARLNPSVALTPAGGVKLALRILPHQTCLKALQMNVTAPVKEHINPWAAFAVVGVLQGGVYGQSNIFFAKSLKLPGSDKLSLSGAFRGAGFAAGRDTLSQGIPYMCSESVRKFMLDPLYDTSDNPNGFAAGVKQWTAVLGSSVFATYASQGMHNCQIVMQTDKSVSHIGAFQKAVKQNGVALLWRGAEARVGLLLIVNVLNELLLKKAWE